MRFEKANVVIESDDSIHGADEFISSDTRAQKRQFKSWNRMMRFKTQMKSSNGTMILKMRQMRGLNRI